MSTVGILAVIILWQDGSGIYCDEKRDECFFFSGRFQALSILKWNAAYVVGSQVVTELGNTMEEFTFELASRDFLEAVFREEEGKMK
jgi:hypothetical protein